MGGHWSRVRESAARLPVTPATILLAVAVVLSGILLLDLTAPVYFVTDDWDQVLIRHGWTADAFLKPFHEHIIIAPTFIYHVLLGLFGESSARPFHLVAILMFLLACVLLFVYVRRRVGDWAALILTVMILFLGAAFEDLLWAFQIGYYGSLVGGIGALVALDRDDRKGDIAACVLLLFSVSFSSLALPFVTGAWLELLLNPRSKRERLFMPLVATVFYVLWWLGWGHTADTSTSFSNLVHAPEYMFKAAAAGFTSLFGLATGDGSEPSQPHLIWGKLMLVAFVIVAIWRVRKVGMSRWLAVTVGITVVSLFLAALNQNSQRPPESSRYQLATAILIVLITSDLFRGVKVRAGALVAAAVVAALSINGGIGLLKDQAHTRWQPFGESTQASLAAVSIAGESMVPDYPVVLGLEEPVPHEDVFRGLGEHGRLGYSESQLADSDPSLRLTADSTLITALGIQATSTRDVTDPVCQAVKPTSAGSAPVEIRPGPHYITNSGSVPLNIYLARFADPPGQQIGAILPESSAGLNLPFDSSSRPWTVVLAGNGNAKICSSSSQ